MKQIVFTLFAILLMVSVSSAQNYRVWEKSKATSSYPSYLSQANGSTERGFAYGKVGGNDRIYVVTRNGGNKVVVVNAATGDSVGALNTTGITGGTFPINDIDVSSDGVIFAANVALGTAADSVFKVYKWTDESAAPTTVIQFVKKSTFRLGDKITITGSTADNSIIIWTATASKDTVVKFTTTDNGSSFTPNYIKMSNGAAATAASPSVAPIGDGSTGFFVKSAGKAAIHFNATGTKIDSIPTTIGASGSSAIRYFEYQNRKFVLLYNYGASTTTENMTLLDVTSSVLAAKTVFKTTSMFLSGASNANGTGDLAVKKADDGSYVLYVFGTNMGMSSYLVANTFSIKNAKAETTNSYVPDLLGTPVTVTGVVSSPNFTASSTGDKYYIYDGTTGIALSTTKKLSASLSLGDTITVKGRIAQTRGLTQIVPLDTIVTAAGSISVPKSGVAPSPVVVSIADLNSEKYEGSLVTVKNLIRRSSGADWPSTSVDTRLTVGTLTDSTTLSIYADANIGGNAEPTWDQNVTGIASQYSSSDTAVTDGYELVPRSMSDFSATPAGTITVKVIPQGFYNSADYLNSIDTVSVLLANAVTPYGNLDSTVATLDSLTFSASASFNNVSSGNYYVVVKHRNSIETWSALPVTYTKGSTIAYDFTDAQTEAYGDNLIQVSASPVRWAIYGGDSNQDGYVDPLDMSLIDQDSFNYLSGLGLATDINGDHFVDPLDMSIADQNSFNYVGVRKPSSGKTIHAQSKARQGIHFSDWKKLQK